jgi:hypothetical protein
MQTETEKGGRKNPAKEYLIFFMTVNLLTLGNTNIDYEPVCGCGIFWYGSGSVDL